MYVERRRLILVPEDFFFAANADTGGEICGA